ncbi:type II secretion system protein N [Serratia marcescens]|uniref:type II secretion system protein N n=1 Tax=Serratia marcescens TaxID=615 RepID=UPI0024350491|nr:type II secretion system protein N [Serratia marcescens]
MSKRLTDLLILLFCLINLAFMLQLGWRVVAGDGAPVEPSRENARGPVRHSVFPQEDDIGKINDAHWFGRYQAAKNGEKAQGYKVGEWAIGAELLANAPEAAALGKIAGLLFSDNAKKSLVIVEHGGKQTGYGVGDRLAGSNAVIVRIVKNKILLDENGYYATLTFKE